MQNKMAIYTDDAVFFCDTLTYDNRLYLRSPETMTVLPILRTELSDMKDKENLCR